MVKGPRPTPFYDRVMAKVDRREDDECWPWLGYVMPNGYGKLTHTGAGSNLAHRLVYEMDIGPIPKGLDIDHLCRVRHCVNPFHLEPVSRKVNLARSPLVRELLAEKTRAATERRANRPLKHNRYKTHCPQGHPYDEFNTRWYRGSRRCKACDRDRHNALYAARKGGGTQ